MADNFWFNAPDRDDLEANTPGSLSPSSALMGFENDDNIILLFDLLRSGGIAPPPSVPSITCPWVGRSLWDVLDDPPNESLPHPGPLHSALPPVPYTLLNVFVIAPFSSALKSFMRIWLLGQWIPFPHFGPLPTMCRTQMYDGLPVLW